MSTVQESLYSYLTGRTAITTHTSNRIYPSHLPQSPTYPCMTYLIVSEEEIETLYQPSTMIGPTFQFDCWATAASTARAIASALRLSMKNLSGGIGGTAGITVAGVEKISSVDSEQVDADGRIIAYVVSADYQIWYQEG
jgi:hypothetical protein